MLNHPFAAVSSILVLVAAPAFGHDWQSSRPDAHAPISVMGDHTHDAGEFMLSFRHMRMEMNDLYKADDRRLPPNLMQAYSYAMMPTSMTMEMEMLGGMYAPTDSTTLMFMLPYIENNMDMLMAMPGAMSGVTTGADMPMEMAANSVSVKSSMKSSGIGDLKLGVLHNLYDEAGRRVHLNMAVSVPTGSIDEEGDNNQQLPYRMQLGSGTYDLLPGITYAAQYEGFSWGAQAQATFRLDKNDNDYRLGNRFLGQAWIQKPVYRYVAVSARLAWEKWGNINGEDEQLNPMMTPLADPGMQGGSRSSAGLGASAVLPAGNRLALEYNKVLEQNLDGPQLGVDDSLMLAWQFSF